MSMKKSNKVHGPASDYWITVHTEPKALQQDKNNQQTATTVREWKGTDKFKPFKFTAKQINWFTDSMHIKFPIFSHTYQMT